MKGGALGAMTSWNQKTGKVGEAGGKDGFTGSKAKRTKLNR